MEKSESRSPIPVIKVLRETYDAVLAAEHALIVVEEGPNDDQAPLARSAIMDRFKMRRCLLSCQPSHSAETPNRKTDDNMPVLMVGG